MKIFFACSMRGGYGNVSQEYLRQIPLMIKTLGHSLMSMHQTQDGVLQEELKFTTTQIYQRDYDWLRDCDAVIAEISNASLGVGGEISDALELGKSVLAIYQQHPDQISAYTRGKLDSHAKGQHARYTTMEELEKTVKVFLSSIKTRTIK